MIIRSITLLAMGALVGGAAVWLLRAPADESAVQRAGEAAPQTTQNTQTSTAETRFAVTAHQLLAADDAQAALADLQSMDDPAERRAAAIGLLDVLGHDTRTGDSIAAALPARERDAFRVARLAYIAATDPDSAFHEMLGLTGTLQEQAAAQIAAKWAGIDPLRALAQATLLPTDAQTAFRRQVWREWSRLDPSAVLAQLESGAQARPAQETVDAIARLAIADPRMLLAAADRMPAAEAAGIRMNALTALAEHEPEAARQRIQSMPSGRERDALMSMVAMTMARHDPEGAIAWVDDIAPDSPATRMMVAAGVAQSDPLRALDLLGQDVTSESAMIQNAVLQSVIQDPAQTTRLATALVERVSVRDRVMLANLMNIWLQQHPDGAMAWLQTRTDVHPDTLGVAAANMANRDPVRAASYAERIPAALRDRWIVAVAGPYARTDPDEAQRWLAQFQGQPFYEAAHQEMERQIASTRR